MSVRLAREKTFKTINRRGENAAVKLATRRSLAAVAEAAHQDVAEALALEEALTVSSREAALLEYPGRLQADRKVKVKVPGKHFPGLLGHAVRHCLRGLMLTAGE